MCVGEAIWNSYAILAFMFRVEPFEACWQHLLFIAGFPQTHFDVEVRYFDECSVSYFAQLPTDAVLVTSRNFDECSVSYIT